MQRYSNVHCQAEKEMIYEKLTPFIVTAYNRFNGL
jgi:hypothetical protein